MKLSQFKFKLPEEKIALHPTKYRDESRLMVLHKRTGEIEHKMFKDILNYLMIKTCLYSTIPRCFLHAYTEIRKNRCAYRSVLVARVERGIAFVGRIGRSGT